MNLDRTFAENPFANYNGVVFGGSFIGRAETLSTIRQRIILSSSPGSLALIGPKRIGKSSVAWHSFMHPKAELHELRLLPVWLAMGTLCISPEDFFVALVKGADEELRALNLIDSELGRLSQMCIRDIANWMDFIKNVKDYFVRLRSMGWRAVFVVDEFDYARAIFQTRPQAFQGIRELANNPASRVTFVTTSRRLLYEIERQADPSGSTLAGVLHPEYLRCFDDQELALLLGRLSSIEFPQSSQLISFTAHHSGGHPFLASQLAFHLAKRWLVEGVADLDGAMRDSTLGSLDYYRDTIDLLKEEKSLETLLEVILGPVVHATKADAYRLVDRGLIRPSNDGYYCGFSEDFTDYLRTVARSVDLWPLWSQAECALRDCVDYILRQTYHETLWADEMAKTRPKLTPIVENWKRLLEREQKCLGPHASQNILDFAYPADLWQVMKAHFKIFSGILGKDEAHWEKCFTTLAMVRTRLAHNRPATVDQESRDHAEVYCRELIKAMQKWRRSAASN